MAWRRRAAARAREESKSMEPSMLQRMSPSVRSIAAAPGPTRSSGPRSKGAEDAESGSKGLGVKGLGAAPGFTPANPSDRRCILISSPTCRVLPAAGEAIARPDLLWAQIMQASRALRVPRTTEPDRRFGTLAGCVRQAASGVENPATSLARSTWRLAPVFSNNRPTWVLIVDVATPSAAATSGMPPTSTIAISTRSSVGVR
jgi:hypothetical protein